MANTIRVLRSASTNVPSSLAQGELANSELGSPNSINELFIGTAGPSVFKLLKNTGGNPAEPNQNLTTGIGISGAEAGSSIAFTISLALDELPVDTMVAGDWIAFDNAGTPNRALVSAINLGLFNNDQDWIPSSGGVFTGNITLDGPITTADFGTGGRVKDGQDNPQPIGFNLMPKYELTTNQTLDLARNGMFWHKGSGGTVTVTCNNDGDIPIGATYIIFNDDAENLTIAEGTANVFFIQAGGAKVQGDVVLNLGGLVTVYKHSNTDFYVWGAIAAGASGSFSGLSDTNITSPSDAAMVLFDTGSGNWRDALMSGHGTLNDTGVLSLNFANLTDMTGGISGTTEFILQNGSIESRKAASEIALEFFNNAVAEFVSENDSIVVAAWQWVLDEDAFGSNSNTHLATQQSIKAYVDNAGTSGMTHRGGYNASTNSPALDTGSPTLSLGDLYTVTVAGTFFTVEVEVGDVLISDVDSTDAASINDWTIVQTNIGAASESVPGYIELATQAEMDTGTDDLRAVTPLKYANSIIDGGTF